MVNFCGIAVPASACEQCLQLDVSVLCAANLAVPYGMFNMAKFARCAVPAAARHLAGDVYFVTN
jgi:hypothetical protein